MDDEYSSDSGPSTAQTLASVLSAGLGAYVDSQNHQGVTVTTPLPQTAYGYAGYGQPTPTATPALPSWLIPVALVVVVVVLLKK
jgi:hypothetical protein